MLFTIKKNDTKTALKATLKDAAGSPVDLTASTIRFIAQKVGKVVIDREATFVDAVNGIIQYEFQSADTAEVGKMKAEFEVTYPDGKVETFPNSDYIIINVEADLG